MTLLPYLITDQCAQNQWLEQTQKIFGLEQFKDETMLYDPRVLGDAVIFVPNLANAAAANAVILDHRVDWRTVRFSGQTDTDPMIPVEMYANNITDTLDAICGPDTVTVPLGGNDVTFTIILNIWEASLRANGISYPSIKADAANGTNVEGSHGKFFLGLSLYDHTMFTPPLNFQWPQANGADVHPYIFIAKPHPQLGQPICRDLTPDLVSLPVNIWFHKTAAVHYTPANLVASSIYPLDGPKKTALREWGDYTFEYTHLGGQNNLEHVGLTGIVFTSDAARVTAIQGLAVGSDVAVVLRIPAGHPSRKITTFAEYLNPTLLQSPLDLLLDFKKNDIAFLDATHFAIRTCFGFKK